MNLDRANTPAGEEYATVYVAFELSKAKWRPEIILPGAKKMSRYTIDGGDTAGLSPWDGWSAAIPITSSRHRDGVPA